MGKETVEKMIINRVNEDKELGGSLARIVLALFEVLMHYCAMDPCGSLVKSMDSFSQQQL